MTQETTGHVASKRTEEESACEKDMIRAQNTGEDSITGANGLSCGGSNESKKMTQETTGHVASKRTEEEAPVRRQKKVQRVNIQSCDVTSLKVQRRFQCLGMFKRPLSTACEKDMIRAQNTGEDSITGANGLSCGGSNESKKMTQETTGHVASKRTEEEAPVRRQKKVQRVNIQSCDVTSLKVQRRFQCLGMFKRPLSTACEKDMIRAQNTGEDSITGANGLSCGGSNESKKMTQETPGHVAIKRTEEEVGIYI
ncbi:uncharacterized protein RBU33_017866 [Hipposideros larvatus]